MSVTQQVLSDSAPGFSPVLPGRHLALSQILRRTLKMAHSQPETSKKCLSLVPRPQTYDCHPPLPLPVPVPQLRDSTRLW